MNHKHHRGAVALWVTALFILLALAAVARCEYLTQQDRKVIENHWAHYKYAANITGIPVEILPALHYREHQLKNTGNIGGPFMLDRGGSGKEFAKRIRAYEKMVWAHYGGKGPAPMVRNSFKFAALVAAHEFKTKDRGLGLADAAWGYNGRIYGEACNSPYVWNDPKAGRVLRVWYRRADGEVVEYNDTRPGVMLIYHELLRRNENVAAQASYHCG